MTKQLERYIEPTNISKVIQLLDFVSKLGIHTRAIMAFEYLLSEERADEAEQVLSRLLEYMPQHMGAHLILSDIYLAQNKPTQRKKTLEKGLQIAIKRQHPSIAQFKEALKL